MSALSIVAAFIPILADQLPSADPAILDTKATTLSSLIRSPRYKGAGRSQAPMSLDRKPYIIQKSEQLSRRLPRVIQTYSKKSKSSAKPRSTDSSSISTGLHKDILDEIGIKIAGVSPKESVSKSIRLSRSPKQVNSLIKELVGNKAESRKHGQTRTSSKRHRRAAVHHISLLRNHKEPSSDFEVIAIL